MDRNDFLTFFGSLFDEELSEELNMDTEFRYLDNWSSLTGFYFISDMKDKYGITIDVPEFKSCETVEDLYNLYNSKK